MCVCVCVCVCSMYYTCKIIRERMFLHNQCTSEDCKYIGRVYPEESEFPGDICVGTCEKTYEGDIPFTGCNKIDGCTEIRQGGPWFLGGKGILSVRLHETQRNPLGSVCHKCDCSCYTECSSKFSLLVKFYNHF